MARTKQTAQVSTGGNAPRRRLAASVETSPLEPPTNFNTGAEEETAPPPQLKSSEAHEVSHDMYILITYHELLQTYCPVCCDGSDSLLLCDRCPRIICQTHLGDLPSGFDLAKHDFLCMACHVELFRKMPYRVSIVYSSLTVPDSLQAFYRIKSIANQTWIPSLAKPITLHAEYSLSRNSHVSNTPTLILHFRLAGLASKSFPPGLIEFVLREYLSPPLLRFIEVPYDFTNGLESHKALVSQWAEAIS